LDTNHLFLRNPRGGVEDVQAMKEAGFGAIFCNVGDFPPTDWDTVRERAWAQGIACGPWLRPIDSNYQWLPEKIDALVEIAEQWGAPFIVNSEAEMKGSGSSQTSYIAEVCGEHDWALCAEPWPFADVDWSPVLYVPLLAQISPDYADAAQRPEDCVWQWHSLGFECVLCTFGSFGGQTPDMYDLSQPYGVYTADDCLGDYAAWGPRSKHDPCEGGDMTQIGSQDGIKAAVNRLRDLDPSGTLLKKAGGSWPDISSLNQPVDQWKAYDKLQRTLQILKDDHDA
jgi:hypothetical protein